MTEQIDYQKLGKHFIELTKAEEEDYSKLSEEELLAILKKAPDFDKFAFPNSWYEKYNLQKKECLNMKEYIKESPWLKRSGFLYVGKEDIAPKPGGNRPVLPAPEVPTITLIENSFSDAPQGKDTTTKISVLDQQDSQQSSACSTTTNETTPQPL